MTATLGAMGAAAFSMRKEMLRYVLIRRSETDPSVVGRSVTPQGNERAMGRSAAQGRAERTTAGVSSSKTPQE
ncbi:MAG: hypothetical protein ACR2JQ_05970 [Mycobacteriales bacterium]